MFLPITYGDLTDLLGELGFYPKPFNEHHVLYFEKKGDRMFSLPICPPETVARDLDVSHIRTQLHWSGRLEKEDFDRYFLSGYTRIPRRSLKSIRRRRRGAS
jgi:hypothetical protein